MGRASTILRWPLWSWRNLAATTVVVLLTLFGIGRVIEPAKITPSKIGVAAAGSGPTSLDPLQGRSSPEGSGPSPTTDPGATSTPSKAPDAAVVESVTRRATAFAKAWTSSDRSRAEWTEGIQPYVDLALAAGLAQTDPANVPATKVTGEAVLLSSSRTSAEVRMPTDGGGIVVTLHRDESSDPWLVSDVVPADQPPGAPTPDLQADTSSARN